jgi:hypothetical protein
MGEEERTDEEERVDDLCITQGCQPGSLLILSSPSPALQWPYRKPVIELWEPTSQHRHQSLPQHLHP